MGNVKKLDLMGVVLLAAVSIALLVGWILASQVAVAHETRHTAREPAVALTDDGRMKLTVTAERGSADTSAATRTASVRPAGGTSLEVALPYALRP